MANLNDKENMQFDEELMKQLKKEELDIVNGGYYSETEQDIMLLKGWKLLPKSFGTTEMLFSPEKIVEGWAKFGVTCVLNGVTPNQYFYKGKEITHKEAIFILLPF